MATLTATQRAPKPQLLIRAPIALLGDPVSRRRLAAVLGDEEFEVVASGEDLTAMLDSARIGFDVAILVGGSELIARGGTVETLRSLRPGCSIVLTAKNADRSLIREALRAGVDGIVDRVDVERVLGATLSAVLAGQLSVPEAIRSRIGWSSLSLRERQVLQLVAEGLTNSEVANRLFLSESTVKSHLSSSFRKLGVSSRAEAAAAVLDPDNGLITCPPASPLISLERELFGTAAAF